jgi:ornithine cyclodeaminase/alanine dehydrogenase-like protein (mu-crystallin family)
MDDIAVARSRFVVDSRAACLAETGDVCIPVGRGVLDPGRVSELGEIIAGLRPGRQSEDEITIFKSAGNAVQDAVVAHQVWARAVERDVGTTFSL